MLLRKVMFFFLNSWFFFSSLKSVMFSESVIKMVWKCTMPQLSPLCYNRNLIKNWFKDTHFITKRHGGAFVYRHFFSSNKKHVSAAPDKRMIDPWKWPNPNREDDNGLKRWLYYGIVFHVVEKLLLMSLVLKACRPAIPPLTLQTSRG